MSAAKARGAPASASKASDAVGGVVARFKDCLAAGRMEALAACSDSGSTREDFDTVLKEIEYALTGVCEDLLEPETGV